MFITLSLDARRVALVLRQLVACDHVIALPLWQNHTPDLPVVVQFLRDREIHFALSLTTIRNCGFRLSFLSRQYPHRHVTVLCASGTKQMSEGRRSSDLNLLVHAVTVRRYFFL
ncbi:hypothetical protein BDW60DRAFT_107407 [Aspergillus nidulans var. acristatus]